MKEWTEQEEQEMIERAKAGDPEANYELSQWALSRGEEEPDEPRWNRLAAKCLVKAAQAGYGPALEQMEGILHPDAAPKPAPAKPAAPQKTEPAAPIPISGARQAAARKVPGHQTTARRPGSRPAPVPEDDGFDEDEDDYYEDDEVEEEDDYDDEFDEDEDDYDEPAPRRKSAGRGRQPAGKTSGKKAKKASGKGGKAAGKKAARSSDGGGKWGDAQWRRLEIVCVAVCAVLLVFIAVMIFTGRRPGAGSDSTSAIPPAGDAATVQSSSDDSTPAPASEYPDQATKDAIMAADLAIQPEEEDYMTAPTTATVSVSSQYLRLRKGPNTTYDPIAEMPNETVVDVYATKNDWDLVLFQGDEGPIYGWCSSEYLIITAGAAAGPNAVN